jgi:pimeloyl-ACP methyl ester carboxylesterase
VKLNYREFPSGSGDGRPLVLLHGLFGSAANWGRVARELSDRFHVIVPDLRNHGRSPHAAEVGYPAMSGDLIELLDGLRLDSAGLIGHSMGGKVAMWTALQARDRVDELVVVDMAPVRYGHDFEEVLAPLRALPLAAVSSRRDADARLGAALPDPALRGFLLQNLESEAGRWRWRLNLEALSEGVSSIVGFPDPGANVRFPGKTLFLYGGKSDYLRPEHHAEIRRLFPYARLRALAGAGHWVYADKPVEFVQAVRAFLA